MKHLVPVAVAFGSVASAQITIDADVPVIDVLAGGTQTITIEGTPDFPYLLLGTMSGTDPGILVDGELLPLNFDSYLQFTLASINQGPFVDTLGVLDATGSGTALIQLGPQPDASLAGVTLHHACALVNPLGGVIFSNAERLDLAAQVEPYVTVSDTQLSGGSDVTIGLASGASLAPGIQSDDLCAVFSLNSDPTNWIGLDVTSYDEVKGEITATVPNDWELTYGDSGPFEGKLMIADGDGLTPSGGGWIWETTPSSQSYSSWIDVTLNPGSAFPRASFSLGGAPCPGGFPCPGVTTLFAGANPANAMTTARVVDCGLGVECGTPGAREDGWEIRIPADLQLQCGFTYYGRPRFHSFEDCAGGAATWQGYDANFSCECDETVCGADGFVDPVQLAFQIAGDIPAFYALKGITLQSSFAFDAGTNEWLVCFYIPGRDITHGQFTLFFQE